MSSTQNIFVTRSTEKNHFFADESLENKTAGTCDLFLLIEKSALQMALKERRSGSLLAFEFFPAKDKKDNWKYLLEEVSAQGKILRNYEFQKVTAGIMSPEFTLVPEALFKPGDEEIYFKKNFPASVNISVKAQQVPAFHLYTIFGLEKDLEKELNHLFQDPLILHYSQALLSGISANLKQETGKQIWLNVREHKIDLVVSENKKLILLNSFSWQTHEDILYYTLFACEQLEMNPDKLQMTVTGDIESESSLHKFLLNYLRDIKIPVQPSSISFLIDVDMPFHYYTILYYLSMCE